MHGCVGQTARGGVVCGPGCQACLLTLQEGKTAKDARPRLPPGCFRSSPFPVWEHPSPGLHRQLSREPYLPRTSRSPSLGAPCSRTPSMLRRIGWRRARFRLVRLVLVLACCVIAGRRRVLLRRQRFLAARRGLARDVVMQLIARNVLARELVRRHGQLRFHRRRDGRRWRRRRGRRSPDEKRRRRPRGSRRRRRR